MIYLLSIIACVLCHVASAVQFENLLRTPQYIVLQHYRCNTSFESAFIPGKCPYGMTPHNRPNIFCDYEVRAHLIRDPLKRQPPKMLYVGAAQKDGIQLFFRKINATLNGTWSFKEEEFKSNANSVKFKLGSMNIEDISSTMYDSNNQLLYILYRRKFNDKYDPIPYCLILFIRDPLGARPQVEEIGAFPLHLNDRGRNDWVLDPYTDLVYYSISNGAVTALYKLPLGQLITVLKEGSSGSHVFTFYNGTRSHFRVSANMLFSYGTDVEKSQYAYVRNLNNSEEKALKCKYEEVLKNFHNSPIISTVVIKDDEYCLLRDGEKADLNKCEDERKKWYANNKALTDKEDKSIKQSADKTAESPEKVVENNKEEDSNIWNTILLISVIVLAILLLLSCLCVCWMKRNLDSSYPDDPPRPVPYYANRPGQYVEDVSVDKWNTNY